MNRTIVERVRCMLSHSKLSSSFWGEAMRTAVDLINLSPSYALDGDVPEKVWTGKSISYNYLRVFGCRAFVHIPKDERSKLDSKSKECIFLGYGREQFGYRLWDPVEKKLVRSRDVVFFEDQTIEDMGKADKPKSTTELFVDPSPISQAKVDADDGQTAEDGDVMNDEPTHGDSAVDEHSEQAPTQQMAEQQLRRSTRERQPSQRYPPHEYVMVTDGGEPECLQEAMLHAQKEKWFEAMQEEMKSLHENHTFDLVELPKGKRDEGEKERR